MSRYTADDGPWCHLEIMGHREHFARVKEVDALGGKMLRVCDETEPSPIEYGLSAIFSRIWLTDEDGERANAECVAAQEERVNRRAHSLKIGEIQRLIYLAVGEEKLSYEEIEARVTRAAPSTTHEDFDESIENIGMDRWSVADGDSLYWRDPDNVPF